jgi:putative CocE/NonD family hydrolase
MVKLNVPAVPVLVEHNTPVTMRDGTVLRADVYRPADGSPRPVMLVRNPYGEAMARNTPVVPALDAGFAVVVQHCRGTGTSDGDFVLFDNEAADGVDTIEWCAAQPWCTGDVGTYGASYLGMVQMHAAVLAPPPLKAMVCVVTPADYHGTWAYRQGAFTLGQMLGWHTLKSMQTLAYRASAGEDVSAERVALARYLANPVAGLRRLPLRDAAVAQVLPGWRMWLDHADRDEVWQARSFADHRHQVTTPVFHVGGWFDLFLPGTLDNFVTLSQHAATDQARRNQRLLVGPWTHSDQTGTAGEVHFGPLASAVAAQLEATVLDFLYRAVQSGEPAEAAPVRLFVMGDNVWRDEHEWPLARTEWTRWYLHPDGSLSPTAPAADADPLRYTYDPDDPVPTVGGSSMVVGGPDGGVSWMPGPRDQRGVEARPDVLSFTSTELAEDVELTGPVLVTLYAATSAADTDFTAKLVDVWPDGRALGVVDGIVRARYRDGTGRATPIEPGEVYEYTIDLVATSWVVKAGHRLRVDVSSSNFPCYDRNPGNGAASASATEVDFVVAHQSVYCDASHPSHVTLPVIPRPVG